MDGSLHTIDGRDVLRFERRLAHPVAKVWRAVTDPAELAHWFPATVEVDLRVGGRMRFTFPRGEMDPSGGSVTELDPPRVFAFTWNGDTLRTELSADGDGCLLVFTYTFDDRVMAASYATGWQTCLGALARALGGPAPEPESYAEVHDTYADAFGLGEGAVHQDAGTRTVRFERLLPHPLEEVWPGLTEGAGELRAGGEPPLRITNPHIAAGPLTAAEPRRVLEYAWPDGDEPAGRVRWELNGGHPAGTRVVLTQTVPAHLEEETVTALAAWHTHLEVLADHLRGVEHCPFPEDRVEELRKHYAEAR